ncbi:MAG: NAD-dependent epimerase/dehydratase family protein [Caldilineales bacterium]|nr:NAD-dependent epimerase/dehydratase family protein [Caldilineales bacterium]
MRTLAITGLFSPWGRRIARLASGFGVRVLGIDIKPMTKPFPGVEFVEADIRNPLVGKLFQAENIDTVLHCSFRWRQERADEVYDSNVIGTMRLLEAAATAGVRKVIIPSSAFVYGAHPENPSFIAEDADFVGEPAYAYIHELREIEIFIAGFRRQYPDMIVTTLRFANILGGGVPTPMASYLALPIAPTLLGFEPRMQFIHHDDVLRAYGHCIMNDFNGVYNVAAPEPLPLLKVLALAGVPPAPIFHPLVYAGARWGRKISPGVAKAAPMPWDFLRYSWVAATTRMEQELDFTPTRDAESTIREFSAQLREYRRKTSTAYRVAGDGVRGAVAVSKRTTGAVQEASRRVGAAADDLRGLPETD